MSSRKSGTACSGCRMVSGARDRRAHLKHFFEMALPHASWSSPGLRDGYAAVRGAWEPMSRRVAMADPLIGGMALA
jgi:hypothetical protein